MTTPSNRHAPGLTGVPETMLWPLHNRAGEARRPDGILRDPDAVRIYDAIDYDYVASFGVHNASHAWRALVIDRAVQAFLARHPSGSVIGLGEGLETQHLRVDNGTVRWYSVDLPEALAVRARFLPPDDRHRHLALSALDHSWMDQVDPANGVLVTAQGLFMYLEPAAVQDIVTTIARRFPGSTLVFDTIPPWISRKTLSTGWFITRAYRTPPMPWGMRRDDLEPTLKRWVPTLRKVVITGYSFPRGPERYFAGTVEHIPFIRNHIPAIVEAHL
jgi:O-methyltransferase involved in polyketide biosynthesis